VSVWDVDSGRQVLQLDHCHGMQEITAMALDSSGRRLITGSRTGEVKVRKGSMLQLFAVFDGLPPQVWNYMSTQCVKQMSVCDECGGEEVTGILHLMDKFLTIGWNRRITTFPDVPDVRREEGERGWTGWNKFEQEKLVNLSLGI